MASRSTDEDRSFASVVRSANKNYGEGSVRLAEERDRYRHLPIGIFTLDLALLGGIPEGMISMIYGWESAGKTTIALKLVAETQRLMPDKTVAWIDAETTLDNRWAARLGVDLSKLYVMEPDYGERALDFAATALKAEDLSLLVLDSIPALLPQVIKEDSAEDQHMGNQARMYNRFMMTCLSLLLDERKRGHWPTIVLLNQFRSRIGYGDPRMLPGGNAARFACAVMFEIRNKTDLGKNARGVEVYDHNDHSFTIKKMKTGNSIRAGEFVMIRNPNHPEYQPGDIDDRDTMVTWAKKFGKLGGSAGRYTLEGVDQRFRVYADIGEYLRLNPDFAQSLRRDIISMHRVDMGLSAGEWLAHE